MTVGHPLDRHIGGLRRSSRGGAHGGANRPEKIRLLRPGLNSRKGVPRTGPGVQCTWLGHPPVSDPIYPNEGSSLWPGPARCKGNILGLLMAWNRFVGISMLLYGLINPTGVIPGLCQPGSQGVRSPSPPDHSERVRRGSNAARRCCHLWRADTVFLRNGQRAKQHSPTAISVIVGRRARPGLIQPGLAAPHRTSARRAEYRLGMTACLEAAGLQPQVDVPPGGPTRASRRYRKTHRPARRATSPAGPSFASACPASEAPS